MECQCRNGNLIADVEDNLVVGGQRLMEPLYLGRQCAIVFLARHQQTTIRVLAQIVGVEVIATGVGKLQRAGIGSVDVGKISGVGKDMGAGEVVGGWGLGVSG